MQLGIASHHTSRSPQFVGTNFTKLCELCGVMDEELARVARLL